MLYRNVTFPSARGTAFGVYNLFDDLGKGLGPAIVSVIVAQLGREQAFTVAILSWILCGLILLAMAWTVRADELKVRPRGSFIPGGRWPWNAGVGSTTLQNDLIPPLKLIFFSGDVIGQQQGDPEVNH